MCRLHLRKRCQPRLCRNVRSTPTFYQGRDKMHQRCLEKRAHSPCIRVCAVSAVQRQVARDRQDQRVRRVIGRVQPTADGQPSQRREDSAPQPRRCLNSTFPFNPHRDSMVCEWPPLDEVNSISLLNEQSYVYLGIGSVSLAYISFPFETGIPAVSVLRATPRQPPFLSVTLFGERDIPGGTSTTSSHGPSLIIAPIFPPDSSAPD